MTTVHRPHAAATNANEAIAFAREAIATSDRKLRLAAEYLAFAEEQGKTQREMAAGVGKSVAWVNRLLQWRRNGYQEDTPFGPQSQERDERHDERVREQAREERSGPEQQADDDQQEHEDQQERDERSGPEQQARSRRAHARRARVHGWVELSEHDRATLVRVLGMLGSSHDNEALVAARKAEDIRRRLGLTWDDLIVAATADAQRQAA